MTKGEITRRNLRQEQELVDFLCEVCEQALIEAGYPPGPQTQEALADALRFKMVLR